MTDRMPSVVDASSDYVRRFRLEELSDLERIARGVNMEVTQLDAGAFQSEVIQLKVGGVLASQITCNRRVRCQGNVSFLTMSFLSSDAGGAKWHGRAVSASDVLAVNAAEEFDLVVPPAIAMMCISPVGEAEVVLRNLGGPVFATKLANTRHPIPSDPDLTRRIRGWLAERFAGFPEDTSIPPRQAVELARQFLRYLASYIRGGPQPDNLAPPTSRVQAVRRVEEHLLHDLTIPRTVDELCTVAETSRRTLEYAFRDYFGTSPKRFLKALRLNATRSDLLRGRSDSSRVNEIASAWGFSHMSQFAADYRIMFGERPSETLRRSYPNSPV